MIVITGGAGFIGSTILWKLNQEGIKDVIIVDNIGNSEKWKTLAHLSFTEYIHKSAFIDQIKNKTWPHHVSAIIHMGACSSTTETNFDYLMENNTVYTKLLAEWALEKDIPFIYASSAATYGDGSDGFDDAHNKISSLRPINGYGYSKQLVDLWALNTNIIDKIVGLKFFNVYGPNEYHKGSMRSVVCHGTKQIVDTGEIKLFKSYKEGYADGEQKRDFIYAKDCANIVWWFLQNPTATGIYNIGTGHAHTWNELATAMFNAMNKPININYIEMPDHLKQQYQYFTEAKTTKLMAATNQTFQFTPFDAAIKDYILNYLLKDSAYL